MSKARESATLAEDERAEQDPARAAPPGRTAPPPGTSDGTAGDGTTGNGTTGEEPMTGGPAPRRRASRLIDIAEAAGVHVSTVSRVLNGDPALSIRPETHERVLGAARAQGYRPNALARALKQRRTGALAMVVPLLRNPIWTRLQRGALKEARQRGYVVMIMEEPTEDPRPPEDYRYLVEESRVDGLLLATALRVPEHQGCMSAIPHVYVNRRGPEPGNDVIMDEAGAMRLFVDYLQGLGHERIALVDGPADVDTVHRRVSAARRICAGRGLALTVRHAQASEEGGWDAALRMLRRDPQPTAVGVGSLNQLFGLLGALRTAGVDVPGEMSVVSFDEDECLAFLDVPVTSVCMPLADLGRLAIDALVTRIESGPADDVLIREPITLIQRSSVAAPGAARPVGQAAAVPLQRAPG